MSWMERLCTTYDNCAGEIGKETASSPDGKRVPVSLLPICHTTQIAHIEITVDSAGDFVPSMARTLDKAEGVTVVPCTENSASRANGLEPHPLFDKLQYVAGDYEAFGGAPKRNGYPLYIEKLRAWCASPFSHPAIQAVLTYLEKGTLIADLVRERILICGEDGKLLAKPPENQEKSSGYKLPEDQFQAFVRFSVLDADGRLLPLYENEEVRDCFIRYQAALESETDLCYVYGKLLTRSETAPAKLRNSGDKAKLISSNDSNTNSFTYKGRVAKPWQAVSISFEAMQKSHNALKWLISKQGWYNGDQVVLAWGLDESFSSFMDMDGDALLGAAEETDWDLANPVLHGADTFAAYAEAVRKALDGWGKGLGKDQKVSIMALDSTNGMVGRLSIPYYRELGGAEFIDRLNFWYTTCVWLIEKGKRTADGFRRVCFKGAPAPLDIVKAAYGANAGEKLKKSAVERLLPCIIDSAPLPRDMVALAARRAGSPFSAEDEAEWRFTLAVACALICKQRNDEASSRNLTSWDIKKHKEVYSMALDLNNRERAYLFGRLLAYAEQAESLALYKNGEKRQTNAVRLMHQFSKRPASTWRLLDEQLVYYYGKLDDRGGWFKSQIDAVMDMFDRTGYTDEPLDDVYLLGYHSQLAELRTKKGDKTEDASLDGEIA